MPFRDAEEAYRRWLQDRLGAEFRASDYELRRGKMRENAFAFLRATFWRWAEIAPDCGDAPEVLSVGDVHSENFGLWRDAQSRVVFGVNDFDEAAPMPWPLDLVRLLTSALLGARHRGVAVDAAALAAPLLGGYGAGLRTPAPQHVDPTAEPWATLMVVKEKDAQAFWAEERKEEGERAEAPPADMATLLAARLPTGATPAFYAREAGTGSLGRPRFAAIQGQGDAAQLVWEAKALLPSAWTRRDGLSEANHTAQAALGPHRAPDPSHAFEGRTALRALSPALRKIEFRKADKPQPALDPVVIAAMGRDLAAIHAGTPAAIPDILAALERDPAWLAEQAEAMARLTTAEWEEWRGAPS